MSLIEFAESELRLCRASDEEGRGKEVQDLADANVMELIKVFSEQGHSGFSANYILNRFDSLARYKALKPLSGEDNEWNDCADGLFQNKRCSAVFKDKNRFNGEPYHVDAVVFEEADRATYTNGHSARVIAFPYFVPDRHILAHVKESCSDFDPEMKCDLNCKICPNCISIKE